MCSGWRILYCRIRLKLKQTSTYTIFFFFFFVEKTQHTQLGVWVCWIFYFVVHIHAINLLANQLTRLNRENCLKLVISCNWGQNSKGNYFSIRKIYLISTITSQKKKKNLFNKLWKISFFLTSLYLASLEISLVKIAT